MAEASAQDILWALTGRRLGTCVAVERFRPVGVDCFGGPYKDAGGRWRNLRPARTCCRVALANAPVQRVLDVEVHGESVPAEGYRLGKGSVLERVGACWPAAEDCAEPPVMVRYEWGVRLVLPPEDGFPPPPPRLTRAGSLAALAMGEMATEILNGLCGGRCALPSRLASLSRQGVQMQFLPPGDFIEAGLTGLPLSDALIRSYNPGGRQARSRVYSPDLPTRV